MAPLLAFRAASPSFLAVLRRVSMDARYWRQQSVRWKGR
jgi:hypothetical protein